MNEESMLPKVLDRDQVESAELRLDEFRAAVAELYRRAEDQEVEDDASSAYAMNLIVELKNLLEAIDDQRKIFTEPLQEYIKRVTRFSKALTTPLQACFDELKTRITAYQLSQIDTSQKRKSFSVYQDGARLWIKMKRRIKVVDPKLVPQEFLSPDEELLQAALDAGASEIPGCEVVEEITPALYRKK